MDLLQLLDLTTERGAPLFPYNNKLYYIKSTVGDYDYLTCHTCKTGTARRNRLNGDIATFNTLCKHNCVLDFSFYAKREFIKVAAQNFAERISRTLGEAHEAAVKQMQEKYGNAVNFMVPISQCKSALYRARAATLPSIPHIYADIPTSNNFRTLYGTKTVCL